MASLTWHREINARSMTLKARMVSALIDIHFIDRVKDLRTHRADKALENYSIEKVLDVLNDLGYRSRHVRSERFFRYTRTEGVYEMTIHLSLKYGSVEFIFYLENTETKEGAGGPFGALYRLIDPELRIGLATFGDYDELRVILEKGLGIMEDLRAEMIGEVDVQADA